MRYKVKVVDTVIEEFHYTVDADNEEAACREAVDMHVSDGSDAVYVYVPERDVEIEGVEE